MSNKLDLLKTSWSYQSKEFFQKSTLHGVRYIREEGRPFLERFMWFCFTTIGGIATLIIIVSLWEKFQTNPTITGLDTDFHNWQVPFPSIAFCARNPVDMDLVMEYVNTTWPSESDETKEKYKETVALLGKISIENLHEFKTATKLPGVDSAEELKVIADKVVYPCTKVFQTCIFKKANTTPCDVLLPLRTENGYCFAFNSRQAYSRKNSEEAFKFEEIYETDINLDLVVNVVTDLNVSRSEEKHIPMRIYILSPDEVPIIDISPQHEWDFLINEIQFSSKETYTISDAHQLSISQRRCVFKEEVKLVTDTIYTYTACMSQCRMSHAQRLCGCVPYIYPKTDGYSHCDMAGLACLGANSHLLQRGIKCSCYLGCSHTVYEVEKMSYSQQAESRPDLKIGFVSWPMIRYKREVLFGWVDLLVSFGGIAGLFLGFSLLSGVEVIYYFTMRACCMVYRDPDELRQLRQEYDSAEKPPIDLSLAPKFMKTENTKQKKTQNVFSINVLPSSDFQYLP